MEEGNTKVRVYIGRRVIMVYIFCYYVFHKNSKTLGHNYLNCPVNGTVLFYNAEISPKGTDDMAVLTLIRLLRYKHSDLILHCLLKPTCPNI